MKKIQNQRQSFDATDIQNKIGYHFKNPDLLEQAFIRRSYTEENGGENNEVLEFFGDKALDFIVVKNLYKKHGHIANYDLKKLFTCDCDENKLTKIKSNLVQKKSLAHQIDNLDLAKYLIMGKGDLLNKIGNQKSVKEDLFEAIIGAVAIDSNWNIYDIEFCVETMLNTDLILENANNDYTSLINDWHYKKYNSEPNFEYNNTFTDMFECYLLIENKKFCGQGSSKKDARADLCKSLYRFLYNNNLLFDISTEIDNPNIDDAINQLEILARRGYFAIPTYEFEQSYDDDGKSIWECTCYIAKQEKTFSSKSSSKKIAKKSVAFKMLNFILNNYPNNLID